MNNQKVVKNYFNLYGSRLKNIFKGTVEPIYELIISIVSEYKKKERTILEIGCGMGELLVNLKKEFPDSKIVGIDIADKMIELARKKCDIINEVVNDSIIIMNEDILTFKINENFFDFVITVNTLHHLNDKEKKKVFSKIFEGLVKNGIFIYSDITRLSSNELNRLQQKLLIKKIKKDKVLSDSEKDIRISHLKLDQPMDNENICKVLKGVGFKEFGILYKNLSNTLMVARKG